jgi:hypothetical protein
MEVIEHLWAELGFWFFPEKGVKISAAANIWWTQTFRQVVPVQQAGTVQQRRRPYKLSRSESKFHLRTTWRRGNTIWEIYLQPDWEGVRSWRFCWAQIVRVWRPTFAAANILYRPRRFQQSPCYCRILWDTNILDGTQIFHVGADISWTQIFHGRRYFMVADISWAQIFHGCRYFIFHGRRYFMGANILMGANITWARIFHGREYFDVSEYFVCKLLL